MAVATGFHHTFVITENAQVYAMGNNYSGVLGIGTTEPSDIFLRIEGENEGTPGFNGEHAIMVATSYTRCACVTEEGSLWTWGSSTSGALGTAERFGEDAPRLRPDCVVAELYGRSRARMVALGLEFTMLLTTDGHIWNCGDSERGELGHGDRVTRINWTMINPIHFDNSSIAMISAGWYHSVAQVAGTGLLYTWGEIGQGALGYPCNDPNTMLPRALPAAAFDNVDIASFCAGTQHTMVVTVLGSVYGTGYNRDGQLGLGYTTQTETFQLVGGPNPFEGQEVRTVSCGGNHTLFITNINVLWHCGKTLHRYTSSEHKDFEWNLYPKLVHTKTRFKVASAGFMHSAAIACNGDLCIWGCNVSHMEYEKKPNGAVLRNYVGNFGTPKRMHRIAFSDQRVGRWHKIPYKRAVAIMMSSNFRLASDSTILNFDPDLLRVIMGYTIFRPRGDTGSALRRLIGF